MTPKDKGLPWCAATKQEGGTPTPSQSRVSAGAADLRSQRCTSHSGVFKGEWGGKTIHWPQTFLRPSPVQGEWYATQDYLYGVCPIVIWSLLWRKKSKEEGKDLSLIFKVTTYSKAWKIKGLMLLIPWQVHFFHSNFRYSTRVRWHQCLVPRQLRLSLPRYLWFAGSVTEYMSYFSLEDITGTGD